MRPCSCPECVSACRNDPGRLVPQDIRKMCDFLGLSPRELVLKHLVLLALGPENGRVYALAPAKRRRQGLVTEPGTVAGSGYAAISGECLFLSEAGLCLIHDVKPHECRCYMGCAHTFNGRAYDAARVERFYRERWRGFDWSSLKLSLI